MDNQNNPQNGYTNFNNYQPAAATDPEATTVLDASAQQPQQIPYQNVTPQQMPYQAPQQMPYQNVSSQQMPYAQQMPYNPYATQIQPEKKHKSLVLGILAIVIPIISCSYLSPVGLILALIGVIRNKKSAVSWVGLVISILLCAFLGLVLYFIFNPDEYRAFLEMSGAYTQEEIDAMVRQITGFIAM